MNKVQYVPFIMLVIYSFPILAMQALKQKQEQIAQQGTESAANEHTKEFQQLKSEVAQEIERIGNNIQTILISNAQVPYNTRDSRREVLKRLKSLKKENTSTTNKIQKMLDIIDDAFPPDWYQKNQKSELSQMNKQLKILGDLSTDISRLEEKIRAQKLIKQ